MKYRYIIPVLYVLSLMIYEPAWGQAESNGPQITFEEEKHDFGDIKQGNKVYHTFTFKNSGTKPLIISKVITTCGCTAPSWPEKPIPPGSNGEIKISFDSTGRIGKQNKIITILSNTKGKNAKLMITASVLP